VYFALVVEKLEGKKREKEGQMSRYNNILRKFKSAIDYKKASREKPPIKEVEELCQQAITCQQNDDLEGAITKLTEAMTFDANQEDLYYYRGIFCMQANKLNDAIADFTRVLKLNRQHIAAYGNRGRTWRLLGNLDSALNDYNQIIRLKADSADFYYERGRIHLKMHHVKSALADMTSALHLELTETSVNYYSKPELDEIDTFEDVIQSYTQRLHATPKNTNMYIERALAYVVSQMFEDGLTDVDTYLQRGDGTKVSAEETKTLFRLLQQKVFHLKTHAFVTKRERLLQHLTHLQEMEELLQEKCQRIEQALEFEADITRKVSLEHQGQEAQQGLTQVCKDMTQTREAIQDFMFKIEAEARKYNVTLPSSVSQTPSGVERSQEQQSETSRKHQGVGQHPEMYDLLVHKMTALQKALMYTTDPAEKFRLERQIEELKKELDQIA